MGNQTPAGGNAGAGGRTVDGFERKKAVDLAGHPGGKRNQVDAGEGIIIPGVGVGIGADLGDKAFEIEKLGIGGKDLVHIIKIPVEIIKVFGVFVPGDKIETEVIVGGGFEESGHPVVVVSSGGRAADFINSITGAVGNCPGSLGVEGGIIGILVVFPAAKKIGFVPDFVVDAGDVFVNGIVAGSSFDQLIPFVPVGGGFGIGGVGKGEHGAGAGGKNTVNRAVKAGKIVDAVAFVDPIKIKNMINADQFRLKGAEEGNGGFDHVGGFLAALGEVLPEGGGDWTLSLAGVDDDIGGGAGGTFTKFQDFINGENYQRKQQKEEKSF